MAKGLSSMMNKNKEADVKQEEFKESESGQI